MPAVRKLSAEEVEHLEKRARGLRQQIAEEYDELLAPFAVGDYLEVDPAPDENRWSVRRRFKAAAARRGVGLVFRRVSGTMLRFQVVEL